MKKLNIYIIITFLNITTFLAQPNLIQGQYTLTKNDISLSDLTFLDYSNSNFILLQKSNNDTSYYYRAKLENDSGYTRIGKQELLFSFPRNNETELVQFSKNDEQIVFRRKNNGKKGWEIRDINTKHSITIESDRGPVSTASFYDIQNYLYIIYPQNDRGQAYLVKNNQKPIFIGNGSSVLWAPNGKYFLLKSPLDSALSLREKRKFGKITDGEYKRQLFLQGGPKREIFSRYMIYNTEGERLLVLKDYDFVDWIQWSPDSKKLVLRERSDLGFKIVYLKFKTKNSIEIANVYQFPGFTMLKRELTTFCQTPKWSPDARKILFTTKVEDGHTVFYNNAYILNDLTYDCIPVLETSNVYISTNNWISKNSILLRTYIKNNKRERNTYEIIFNEY